MPLNQQDKKKITVLEGVMDPDYHVETGLTFHNENKKDYVLKAGFFFRIMFVGQEFL